MKTLLLAIVLLCAKPLFAQVPRVAAPVDPGSRASLSFPSVASFGDLSVITYLDSGTLEVTAVTSDRSGLVWSAPVRVSQSPGLAPKTTGFQNGNETVAVHGDHIYATFLQNPFVRFQRSVDRGVTFEAFDRQLGPPQGQVNDWSFSVARDPNGDPSLDHIHVLMETEDEAGSDDIYMATSLNGGESFTFPIAVSSLNGTGLFTSGISIASEGNHVYCTWIDNRNGGNDQWVAVSNDGGLSFGPEVTVSGGFSNAPINIAAAGDGLVVTSFGSNRTGSNFRSEVYAATSLDFGQTWSGAVLVGNYDTLNDSARNSEVAISDGNIIMIWEDDRMNTRYNIHASVSVDKGATWAQDIQLSATGGDNARFSKDSNDVLVASWDTFSTPGDAMAAYSLDDGLTFTNVPMALNNTPDNITSLEIALNASLGNLIACWRADDASDSFGARIYAGGFSVGGPAQVLTRSAMGNPDVYGAGIPLLGTTSTADIDASQTGHALTALLGFLSNSMQSLPGGQVLLINLGDPAGELLGLAPLPGPQAAYSIPIPNDPELCGVTLFTQGALLGGGPPFALTNAQDLVLGSY